MAEVESGVDGSGLIEHCYSLLQRQNHYFKVLKVGPLCNASDTFPFTEAYCHLSQKRGPRFPYGISMASIFRRGFKLLHGQMKGEKSQKLREETEALSYLDSFLEKIDVFGGFIKDAITVCEKRPSFTDQTVLKMALADHLIRPLSSDRPYVINQKERRKGVNMCRCGCETPIKFGNTGIGHHRVWHGFVDILLYSHPKSTEAISAVKVCLDENTLCADDSAVISESPAKKAKLRGRTVQGKLNNDVSSPFSPVEKLKFFGMHNEVVAQTIVFAMARQSHQSQKKVFVPNILISTTEFIISMYDPTSDILLWSKPFLLWNEDQQLQVSSVVALWMSLHYEIFCSSSDIFKNPVNVCSHFREHIDSEHWTYYQQLEIGVNKFDTVQKCEFLFTNGDYEEPEVISDEEE